MVQAGHTQGRAPGASRHRWVQACLAGGTVVLLTTVGVAQGRADDARPRAPLAHYDAKLRVPPTLAEVRNQVEPGNDAFPEEKTANELAARLEELGALLRGGQPGASTKLGGWLTPDFHGGAL